VANIEHYEEDYGERVLEHIDAELGLECTEFLRTGSGLNPQIIQALLEGTDEAKRRVREGPGGGRDSPSTTGRVHFGCTALARDPR